MSDAGTDFTKCAIDKENQVLIALSSFGGRAPSVAIERLKKIAGNGAKCTLVCVYGNRAYKKAGGAGLVPEVGTSCKKCSLCAESCPVQAIDPATFKAYAKKCISCMRCVKQCPEQSRSVNGAIVSIAAMAIKKACFVRKENELFL